MTGWAIGRPTGGRRVVAVLVLALDTATSRITAGVVELPDPGVDGVAGEPRPLGRVDAEGSRAHAELLAPAITDALRQAGIARTDLDAVVCGVGPGPFTGLRVGMVTAIALGDGLRVPVHGVVTHDAIAVASASASASGPGSVLAVTDARRREVYWARVEVTGEGAVRTDGPEVCTPAALVDRLPALGHVDRVVGDAAALVGATPHGPPGPTPEALVAVAAGALRSPEEPARLVPAYLRRPDAVPPAAPKTVTPAAAPR